MKQKIIIIFCFCSIVIIVSMFFRKNFITQAKGKEKILMLSKKRSDFAKKLPIGTSKADVRAQLGEPDNINNRTVWLWTESGIKGSWQELIIEHPGFF